MRLAHSEIILTGKESEWDPFDSLSYLTLFIILARINFTSYEQGAQSFYCRGFEGQGLFRFSLHFTRVCPLSRATHFV